MKAWRDVAFPHSDVLKGTFKQTDFAADITAVKSGKAPVVYQDAAAFFERTFITEGMRLLLTQVAQRLSGLGGEPVIQLQTAFGGGKTHTMLAVLHLATRTVPLSDLTGIPTLVERAGLMDVPVSKVAVIDGTARGPSESSKRGKSLVRTLWGELAWQLGGDDGFRMVKESDENGTSPGKEILIELLTANAPCVLLMDEVARYVGQFEEGKSYSGGTFDSNISFVQSLTEAVKLVPNAVLLASLPDSAPASSGERGRQAIRALEHIFGRVHALWKPVATEEAFEIVRRRLFESLRDLKARDEVCRAFADAYSIEGSRLPSETQEVRYFDRLCQAYPIHPEVFDRLYEDWTTIEGFQRTRGVLTLMAKVIARLWRDENQDLMILPGSLPLAESDVRNELTYLLPAGWEPVIEGDIDGDRAETTELEKKEPRFGQVAAARRVAQGPFLGTAPSSVPTKPGIRGLDRGRVLLGCLQPGQVSAVYADALGRLADRLHYLNSTGDKSDPTTRYWFDTRANLRREMENRKRRFDDATDVLKRIKEVVEKLFDSAPPFEGLHVFIPHSDVPDDRALRLVVLPPEQSYMKDSLRQTSEPVLDYLKWRGDQPRQHPNRLIFVAADHAVLGRMRDATRVALAWESIVKDVDRGRLNIDMNQRSQAEKESEAANKVLPKVAQECFRWLLCPVQDDPRAERPSVEAFAMKTTSGTAKSEVERVCGENDLVITAWSPIHLRSVLKDLYWKNGRSTVSVATFWEDSLRYLYLPRLKNRDVLSSVIRSGAASKDYFGTAYGETEGTLDGFQFGEGNVSMDGSLLLIEPEAAKQYELAPKKTDEITPPDDDQDRTGGTDGGAVLGGTDKEKQRKTGRVTTPAATSFRGSAEIPAATAKIKLLQIAEEIVSLLNSDPNAEVGVTLEITADFTSGVSDTIKRAVTENATNLGFKSKEWE